MKYDPEGQKWRAITYRFTYHPPKDDQVERYEIIRQRALDFARTLVEMCPPSRELSEAVGRVEEAVMYANASIARNE